MNYDGFKKYKLVFTTVAILEKNGLVAPSATAITDPPWEFEHMAVDGDRAIITWSQIDMVRAAQCAKKQAEQLEAANKEKYGMVTHIPTSMKREYNR